MKAKNLTRDVFIQVSHDSLGVISLGCLDVDCGSGSHAGDHISTRARRASSVLGSPSACGRVTVLHTAISLHGTGTGGGSQTTALDVQARQ